jgi:hypothetical protein
VSNNKDLGTSLIRLGFNDEEKLTKFLAMSQHNAIQLKFDAVFPVIAKPKFASSEAQIESPSELDLGADLDLGGGEEMAMSDDKDLDLADGGELSIGDDDFPQSLPDEGGLDLSLGDDDFSLGDDELSAPDDATSLKLGDDVNLGGDVLAKLAEIEEIMQADATSATMLRANLSQDSSSGDLDLAGDEFLSSQIGEEMTSGSAVFMGGELEEEPAELSFDSEEEIEIEAPKKAPAKKALPTAPVLEQEDDELSFDAGPDEAPEIPRAAVSSSASSSRSSPEERSGFEDVKGHYNHELERLQATLNHLRSDRAELLKKIETLEEDKAVHSRNTLGMRAELDEKKIEIQLMKRRLSEEGLDLKYQVELETERRKLAEERAKTYQAEVVAMQQKIKLEVKKVSSRERELEQRLELLKSDAETQIRHRDQKILELKRRMDAMEFDMEAMNAIEQKTVGDKTELEGKLDKAIKTLRTAIGILESDDPKLATLEKLKKNLEV